MSREEFLSHVWEWKNEKGDEIFKQLRTLGASLDWERTAFTMSDSHTEAVNEAFVRLFDKGLIYRGDFLVNWSCALGSTISDIEVDRLHVEKRTKLSVPGYDKPVDFGLMYEIDYALEDDHKKTISIATTR